jgi:hypothetical protein
VEVFPHAVELFHLEVETFPHVGEKHAGYRRLPSAVAPPPPPPLGGRGPPRPTGSG